MSRGEVLVVDDESGIRFAATEYLRAGGVGAHEASTCAEAEEACRTIAPDVVILDYQLPDGDALALLPRLRAIDPGLPVVLLTGHGSIDLAVRAIQAGADQFLTKPVDLPALRVVVERLLQARRERSTRVAAARKASSARDPFFGTSPAIRALAAEARDIVGSSSPVLILGETGTGKGVLARWLHEHGPRSERAFVDVNCAGLSRELLESELFGHERGAFTGATSAKVGLFEVAHRGTVFLDEVAEMDALVQPKLLKVIEEKRLRRLGEVRDRVVDTRVVAATHQDLPERVRAGQFRRDLFFRLDVIELRVPALRERAGDIPALADALLARLSTEMGRTSPALSSAAHDALASSPWPGNVRELRNVLERALLRCRGDVIDADLVRLDARASDPRALAPGVETLTLSEVERRHIQLVLQAHGGNVTRAAEALGIGRSSLYEKLRDEPALASPAKPASRPR